MATYTGTLGDYELDFEPGVDDGSIFTHSDLVIELNIFTTTELSPVVGPLSELEQTGFKYDKTIIRDLNNRNNYNTYIGGLSSSLCERTLITDWKSGILNGIELDHIDHFYQPKVSVGDYTTGTGIYKLYSDFSVSGIINTDYFDGSHYVFPLEENYDEASISIRYFKRNQKLINQLIDYIELDSDQETLHNVYSIDNDSIVIEATSLNKKHGINPSFLDYDNITTYCVELGRGNDSTKDFFLDYFPVDVNSVRAFIVYDDNSVEEWPLTDSLDYVYAETATLLLDEDLGVITSGGAEYSDLRLLENITDADTIISVYDTSDLKGYPLKGILNIGSEQIAYSNRHDNYFYDCTRGYNATIADAHVAGDSVSIERRGYPITSNARLFAYYESCPRIDYEVTAYNLRTANDNVKPSLHTTSSKILEISTKTLDLDSLVLETDRSSVGGSVYGPMYFGTDTSKLIVTAYDSNGNQVQDIDVTLEITDPAFGLIDGETTSVEKVTNSEGKAFAYYNSPVDIDVYAEKFDSVNYSSGSTIFNLSNFSNLTTVNDVFIFQILKHDPLIGTQGWKLIPLSYSDVAVPGITGKFTFDMFISDEYLDGFIYVFDNLGNLYTRTISKIVDTVVYVSENLPAMTIDYVLLFREDDVIWDPETLNGIPVVLYEWNATAIHPVTGDSGAFCPVFPSALTTSGPIYSGSLPAPAPEDPDSNLGGYLIVAPKTVSIRAYAVDPYSGETIYSNTISFIIKLPPSLRGVDFTGTLPVPTGFNLSGIEEDIGSGIGGANFFTINRNSGVFGLTLRLR